MKNLFCANPRLYPRLSASTKGFTLLEVIVAIFILTVGVGGSFALIQQTLSFASLVEERLIASYLAQEGIEIVRNIRDTNWLEQKTAPTTPWNDGLTNCQPPTNCCEGDYITDTPPSYSPLTSLLSCNYDSLQYLNIDANGFYSYSSGSPTKFKRKILIEKPAPDKVKVSVEIIWKERGRIHSFETLEDLTNWYEL
ncbi:MAG: prepilin-type N-terminal cleavage/methylation domain-containing protein [Candidatus Aminicenantia bacterium]